MARRKIEDRQALAELHVRLHAAGKLSLRQIAEMSGVAASTVHADIKKWHADLFASIFNDPEKESNTPPEPFDNGPESNTATELFDSAEEVR